MKKEDKEEKIELNTMFPATSEELKENAIWEHQKTSTIVKFLQLLTTLEFKFGVISQEDSDAIRQRFRWKDE